MDWLFLSLKLPTQGHRPLDDGGHNQFFRRGDSCLPPEPPSAEGSLKIIKDLPGVSSRTLEAIVLPIDPEEENC